jgi:hypothetical protein
MAPENTTVLVYASLESAPEPKVAVIGRVLVEAKLFWGPDLLGVAHVRPENEVRIAQLGLEVPGGHEHVVARVEGGCVALVTPSGERVPPGCRMTLRLGRARLRLTLVDDDVPVLPKPKSDPMLRRAVLGAAILHLGVAAIVVHGRASEASLSNADLPAMQRMLAAADERAAEELAASLASSGPTTLPSTDRGAEKKPDEGAAGNPSRTTENKRARITKRSDGDERAAMFAEATSFGMIGLVSASPMPEGGRSRFAEPLGESSMGNLFGDSIGDAIGAAGLDLSGAGEGAGGFGGGVQMGGIGGLHHGKDWNAGAVDLISESNGTASGWGCGCGIGRLGGTHVVQTPKLRMMDPVVNGRLPPEAIQRIVRANLGRMRGCYADGLAKDPSLEGRVAVKFVIDREGRVSFASAEGSSFPSQSVSGCVARAFDALEFPAPEGGIVTVIYPLVFTPS